MVDDNLEANEEIIGLQPLKCTSADDVFPVIKDVLLRLNLNISDAQGQCYVEAGTMMGKKSGIATKFKEINSKMLTVHLMTYMIKVVSHIKAFTLCAQPDGRLKVILFLLFATTTMN